MLPAKQATKTVGMFYRFIGPILIGDKPLDYNAGDILDRGELEGVNIEANVQSGALQRLTPAECKEVIETIAAQAREAVEEPGVLAASTDPAPVEAAPVVPESPAAPEAVAPVSTKTLAPADQHHDTLHELPTLEQTPPAPPEAVEATEAAAVEATPEVPPAPKKFGRNNFGS